MEGPASSRTSARSVTALGWMTPSQCPFEAVRQVHQIFKDTAGRRD
jgi:hypothetical protein